MMPTAVDLYSGIGGLTTGIRQAGFDVTLAAERDPDLARVYAENHPKTRVFRGRVDDLQLPRGTDLVCGGPPCQPYSPMNRRGSRESGHLRVFADKVVEAEPRAVLMENVPPVTKHPDFGYLLDRLERAGYRVRYGTLNAADFGVPQSRKRLFLLAGRGVDIPFPEPGGESQVPVRKVLANLPSPGPEPHPLHEIRAELSERLREYLRNLPGDGRGPESVPASLRPRAGPGGRVSFGVFRRQRWNAPAYTVTGGCLDPWRGPALHPIDNRPLTAWENMLLQGFPPDYRIFLRNKRKAAQAIGDAVPPPLGRALGVHLLRYLRASRWLNDTSTPSGATGMRRR